MQTVVLTEEIRTGDIVAFTAKVSRNPLPVNGNSYSEYLFANDLRYTANYVSFNKVGKSANVFLLLNSALCETLQRNMGENEADIAYALLTGNSRGMDSELKTAVQQSGIAHIFAVSGLHIGILFGAVALAFSPLFGRKSFLPALIAAICYSALCGFTVSSVRAVIMCGALGLNRALGRKPDLLESLSFAAVIVLLFMPAQWLSAGFRLSFGACLGLALFSNTFSRLFKKLPAVLGKYLAASLSVQLFTFPVLLESFGYFSLWGLLLNLVLIPLLPVLFLGLILCTVFALVIPPAAAIFLFLPKSMISLLLYLFTVFDFSLVLTGFALGAGAAVWMIGAVFLSGRFRMKTKFRAVCTAVFGVVFAACVMMENAVFVGCKIVVYEDRTMTAALVRTNGCAVLLIDGDVTLSACDAFLSRTYGGKLDAVVVLADDEMDGINTGAFLNCNAVYARNEIPTGLRETNVVFAERFELGGMEFYYESREKLVLLVQGAAVEFDFENYSALGADLFVGKGSGGLKYFLKNGIIKTV